MASIFGEYIRKIRLEQQMMLRVAAAKMGISAPYLSRIESGVERPPSVKVLNKMAEVYNLPSDEIISYANERAGEVYGNEILQNAALHVFLRMVKANCDENEIVDIIKKICAEKQIPLEPFLEEIRKRKSGGLPRLAKDREFLFAAQLEPRRLSKKGLAKMTDEFLAKHGLTAATYQAPTPIEILVEKENDIRLIYDDNLQKNELGMSHWSRCRDSIKEIHLNAALDSDSKTDHHRLRFTLGHELFHCLEHLPLMTKAQREQASYSRTVLEIESEIASKLKKSFEERWIKASAKKNTLFTHEDWREWQANHFSACLLMPEWSIREKFMERAEKNEIIFQSQEEMTREALAFSKETILPGGVFEKSLNEIYEVSAQTMAIRLMELNLIRI